MATLGIGLKLVLHPQVLDEAVGATLIEVHLILADDALIHRAVTKSEIVVVVDEGEALCLTYQVQALVDLISLQLVRITSEAWQDAGHCHPIRVGDACGFSQEISIVVDDGLGSTTTAAVVGAHSQYNMVTVFAGPTGESSFRVLDLGSALGLDLDLA